MRLGEEVRKMTVAELRKALDGVPDDMIVVCYDEYHYVKAETAKIKTLYSNDKNDDYFVDWETDKGQKTVFALD